MTYTHTDHDFEFDTSAGYMCGAVATFEYETTFVSRDPECGYPDDRIEVISVELVSVAFGGLVLTRAQMEEADKATLEAVERAIGDIIQEQIESGELEDVA